VQPPLRATVTTGVMTIALGVAGLSAPGPSFASAITIADADKATGQNCTTTNAGSGTWSVVGGCFANAGVKDAPHNLAETVVAAYGYVPANVSFASGFGFSSEIYTYYGSVVGVAAYVASGAKNSVALGTGSVATEASADFRVARPDQQRRKRCERGYRSRDGGRWPATAYPARQDDGRGRRRALRRPVGRRVRRVIRNAEQQVRREAVGQHQHQRPMSALWRARVFSGDVRIERRRVAVHRRAAPAASRSACIARPLPASRAPHSPFHASSCGISPRRASVRYVADGHRRMQLRRITNLTYFAHSTLRQASFCGLRSLRQRLSRCSEPIQTA
jgi:hypothetical protein